MHIGSIRQQGGATILEVLVSVLILSLGILALVGLQARSITAAGDAKYRVEATNYADQIVGQMWADRGVGGVNLATYPTFVAPAAAAWRDRVMGVSPNPPGLPSGAPANSVVVQTRIDNP